jgi:hypothetical protein
VALNSIDGHVDGLEASASSMDTKLTTVANALTTIDGHVDGLEASASSLDAKTPALVGGATPVTGTVYGNIIHVSDAHGRVNDANAYVSGDVWATTVLPGTLTFHKFAAGRARRERMGVPDEAPGFDQPSRQPARNSNSFLAGGSIREDR